MTTNKPTERRPLNDYQDWLRQTDQNTIDTFINAITDDTADLSIFGDALKSAYVPISDTPMRPTTYDIDGSRTTVELRERKITRYIEQPLRQYDEINLAVQTATYTQTKRELKRLNGFNQLFEQPFYGPPSKKEGVPTRFADERLSFSFDNTSPVTVYLGKHPNGR